MTHFLSARHSVAWSRSILLAPGAALAQDAPRTPWGDPDLQGTYTNKTITPPRAARVARREGVPDRRGDLGPATGTARPQPTTAGGAAAAHRRGRQRRRLQQLLARRRHPADQPHVADRRSAKRATPRADGRRHRAQGGPRRGVPGRGSVRLLGGPRAERPLPGLVGRTADAAERLQQQLHRAADAGLRRDLRRDDPRHARHPARRPRPPADEHPAVARRRARPLRGRHARRRDDEPAEDHGQRGSRRRRPDPAPHGQRPHRRHPHGDRAVHAGRRHDARATSSRSTIRRTSARRSPASSRSRRSRPRSCPSSSSTPATRGTTA